MSNALSAREPSMDEILASIRRIIESGDEGVVSSQASDPEPLHGEPANAAGVAADLATDAVAWRVGAGSKGEGVDLAAAAGAPAKSVTDGVGTPGRPRLGIVPPPKPAATKLTEQNDGAFADRPVADLDAVGAAAPNEESDDAAGLADDRDPVGPGSIAAARSRAESLGSVSEHRIDEARAEAMRSVDREEIAAAEVADPRDMETPTDAFEEDVDVLPYAPQGAEVSDVEDAGDAFDEDEFASQLLDNADLISSDPQTRIQPDVADPVMATAAPQPVSVEDDSRHLSADPAGFATGEKNTGGAPMHELISQEAGSRVAASFDNLARVIREEHLGSIDETVGEMLRPMLQEWLDDNLPNLVEKLVREEIERVARGGRR